MPRRLVVTVPDLECIGCRTKAPARVNYVHVEQPQMRADLLPPPGWTVLVPDSSRQQTRGFRKFAICGACYERGQEQMGLAVDAHYEARET